MKTLFTTVLLSLLFSTQVNAATVITLNKTDCGQQFACMAAAEHVEWLTLNTANHTVYVDIDGTVYSGSVTETNVLQMTDVPLTDNNGHMLYIDAVFDRSYRYNHKGKPYWKNMPEDYRLERGTITFH